MKLYEANGNHFLILETVQEKEALNTKLLEGVDGYIIHHSDLLRLELYNKDGTSALFSGNGMICYFHYLIESSKQKTNQCEIMYGKQKAKLSLLSFKPFIAQIEMELPKIRKNEIETGNHHLILICDCYEKAEEYCNRYKSNISYIYEVASNQIRIKTYELGVGWTTSCGSAAIACSYYCYHHGLCEPEVEVFNDKGSHKVIITDTIKLSTESHNCNLKEVVNL